MINEFLGNLTMAESVFSELVSRLDSAEATYDTLRSGVASLETLVGVELRRLLQEAQAFSQEISSLVRHIIM